MRLLKNIFEALSVIHASKKIHRDIKPYNIFLTKVGETLIAKLGDFECSRELTEETKLTKTCIGTTPYNSPEVLWKNPYSYPADIW